MKQFLLSLAFLPILAACGNPGVTFTMETDTDNDDRNTLLYAASKRVVERRLASMGEEISNLDIRHTVNGTQMDIAVENKEPLETLIEVMTQPFKLRMMQEADVDEADIVVEGHGGFVETTVTQAHIDWMQAAEEPGGKGRITISFTEEGRQEMSTVFKDNVGKAIGLFVRDHLVSKLLVETDEVLDDIIITDIPTVQLANVFADDMNVGLHVTFTPIP